MVAHIQQVLAKGSLLEVLIAVVFAGIAASMTSCALARLPVLLGLVSSNSGKEHRGFLLSLAFSGGLIFSYTLIGIVFGVIAHMASHLVAISGYLYLGLGLVMVIGGLFFARLIYFPEEGVGTNCEKALMRIKTLPAAFIFGLLFAFLEIPACPCCGAILFLIASLIAIKGSLLYSGVVFFSFSLGQSIPVLAIGYSTNILKNFVPKTHDLERVISFCIGNILIVSGVFLIMIA
ncbi:MAG: sulfite exporter TauE/SafE family protein [Candidatus Omnitrophica bacterium]|nr:sulfite exporter TauE/SafE family protein [Candidatus Omnitrophota bacterium]